MDVTLKPRAVSGSVKAPPSKSDTQRLLLASALADGKTEIWLPQVSNDIETMLSCLCALGAKAEKRNETVTVTPVEHAPERRVIDCGENGTALRFLLPVASALGISAEFRGSGRLPERPVGELIAAMRGHGVSFEGDTLPIGISGRLEQGEYSIPGNVSSQYVSGLLFALALTGGRLRLTTALQSAPYVDMTLNTLSRFGVSAAAANGIYEVRKQAFHSPGYAEPEGDWTNTAPFLAAGALGGQVTVTGLAPASFQGDRAITEILKRFGAKVYENGNSVTACKGELRGCEIDARNIADLVPVIAVLAACAEGASVIKNAERLRYKESDRLAATTQLINSLGGRAVETADGLEITGCKLRGGTVESRNDHRIAMAAAAASVCCEGETVIENAQAVGKSFPDFFEVFNTLGGAENAC